METRDMDLALPWLVAAVRKVSPMAGAGCLDANRQTVSNVLQAIQLRDISFLRGKQVQERSGDSRSTRYLKISAGLFPKPVRLGVRSVGWPLHEVDILLAARIAGQTDDQIRELVRQLEAARVGFAVLAGEVLK